MAGIESPIIAHRILDLYTRSGRIGEGDRQRRLELVHALGLPKGFAYARLPSRDRVEEHERFLQARAAVPLDVPYPAIAIATEVAEREIGRGAGWMRREGLAQTLGMQSPSNTVYQLRGSHRIQPRYTVAVFKYFMRKHCELLDVLERRIGAFEGISREAVPQLTLSLRQEVSEREGIPLERVPDYRTRSTFPASVARQYRLSPQGAVAVARQLPLEHIGEFTLATGLNSIEALDLFLHGELDVGAQVIGSVVNLLRLREESTVEREQTRYLGLAELLRQGLERLREPDESRNQWFTEQLNAQGGTHHFGERVVARLLAGSGVPRDHEKRMLFYQVLNQEFRRRGMAARASLAESVAGERSVQTPVYIGSELGYQMALRIQPVDYERLARRWSLDTVDAFILAMNAELPVTIGTVDRIVADLGLGVRTVSIDVEPVSSVRSPAGKDVSDSDAWYLAHIDALKRTNLQLRSRVRDLEALLAAAPRSAPPARLSRDDGSNGTGSAQGGGDLAQREASAYELQRDAAELYREAVAFVRGADEGVAHLLEVVLLQRDRLARQNREDARRILEGKDPLHVAPSSSR